MNSKRRAELQRKLSMGAVPNPPADLSDRIKADIPQYLQTDVERARFSGSVAFSMRVAASILLLITTAFVMLRVLETEPEHVASFKARPQLVPAITKRSAPVDAAAPRPQPQPLGEEVRLDIAQEIVPPASAPAPRVAALQGRVAENRQDEREADQSKDNENTVGFATEVQEITANTAGAMDDRVEPKQIAEMAVAEPAPAPAREEAAAATPTEAAASQVAEATPLEPSAKTADATRKRTLFGRRAAPAPAPAPAVMPAPPMSVDAPPPPVETITVQASAPSLMSEAHASEISLRQKPQVFGISVDPKVFLEMKSTLEKGKRPSAATVNVDALVNYFAGPPVRAPRQVTLEVEASPAPIEADGDHAVLRFTIDTPRINVGPRESTPPAAAEARLDIEIDPKAVASFHRIGGTAPVAPESMLLHNLSVTGLYELVLHPQLKAKQHVATVRLSYRSVTDGKSHVLTRKVHGSDLAGDWAHASRRHRLASLGAVWSESLKGAGVRADVAKRAEELATQEPEDARARELANAASATAGGKR
jgi:hypothetical protein